jgi:cell wall-associated NlpC family hydrolase/3D (Asp-Asp-Asp) domain-containing protein
LHTLQDKDVVNDSLGRSDLETYTLYSVGVDTLFSSNDIFKTLGIQPIWYKPYAKKYGIQRLHVTSLYAAVSEKSAGPTTVTLVKSMQTDLYNWNIKNNDYYNGVLVVKGDNKYKIGERLRYESNETGDTKEFYVTSVNHQFENFGTWVTVLGVTRGINPTDRFTSPVGKSEAYSGLGLADYNPKAALAVLEGNNTTVSSTPSTINLDQADAVIKVARSLIGQIEYVFGGPGIPVGMADCSQFTQWCYEKGANLEIGRTTGTQVRKGEKISYQDALPGDIIFFKNTYQNSYIYGVSHVGIYLGADSMIHNSGGYGVHITTNIMGNSYWKPHFLMCRRVLKANTASGPTMSMIATAYGASALNVDGGFNYQATGKTATGTTPKEGRTIAVDPLVIPLHSKVKIECSAYPEVNGTYIAEDTGSAIKGKRIDIYFNDLPPADPYTARARMLKFGRQHVKVTILS